MYEKRVPLFMYCVSPLHMGAGSSLGVIDNPIQRERHTEYPTMAGSGIKGAVRHHFWARLNGNGTGEGMLKRVFGPTPEEGDEFAGALSFSDAQVLAFPVRCTSSAYVYATSPTALARGRRLLEIAGISVDWGPKAEPEAGACIVCPDIKVKDKQILLENFQFDCVPDEGLKATASWLAENALPDHDAFGFFRKKLAEDLVMLTEEDFSYFVRNCTVVEPHVRINDVTGTAEDGGLFYTENLPPETVLVTLMMTTRERTKDGALDAGGIKDWILNGDRANNPEGFTGLDGEMVQIGGDATTGRGQVFFKALEA